MSHVHDESQFRDISRIDEYINLKSRSSCGDIHNKLNGIYPSQNKPHKSPLYQSKPNGRSNSTIFSPPSYWNSRITSKKPSMCDISQEVQQFLQNEKEQEISHRRGLEGNASSRMIFERSQEYIPNECFSNANTPFSKHNEVRQKKDSLQYNNLNKSTYSPHKIDAPSLSQAKQSHQKVKQYGPLKERPVYTNIDVTDKSLIRKINYQNGNILSKRNSQPHVKYQRVTEMDGHIEVSGYSHLQNPSEQYPYQINTTSSNINTNRTAISQEKISTTNVTDYTQDRETRKSHPLLNGIECGLFDQERASRLYMDLPTDRSAHYRQSSKRTNLLTESVLADTSRGEPPVSVGTRKDSQVSAFRGSTFLNVVGQNESEISAILGGLHNKQVRKSQNKFRESIKTSNDVTSETIQIPGDAINFEKLYKVQLSHSISKHQKKSSCSSIEEKYFNKSPIGNRYQDGFNSSKAQQLIAKRKDDMNREVILIKSRQNNPKVLEKESKAL